MCGQKDSDLADMQLDKLKPVALGISRSFALSRYFLPCGPEKHMVACDMDDM